VAAGALVLKVDTIHQIIIEMVELEDISDGLVELMEAVAVLDHILDMEMKVQQALVDLVVVVMVAMVLTTLVLQVLMDLQILVAVVVALPTTGKLGEMVDLVL
jgi:hypothetical protein